MTKNIKQGIVVFLILEGLVAFQVLLTYRDSFFTVSEMQQKGIDRGLPLVWNFGMWGDLFIVSPLAAIIIASYWKCWRPGQIQISTVLGILATITMVSIYSFSNTPEAHMYDRRLTPAGYVHLVYTTLAVTVFFLLFFHTRRPSAAILISSSILLWLHAFIGTHMTLGILSCIVELPWYPDQPLKDPIQWTILAFLAVGLWWRTTVIRRDNLIGLSDDPA
jgi:hypothetical protein